MTEIICKECNIELERLVYFDNICYVGYCKCGDSVSIFKLHHQPTEGERAHMISCLRTMTGGHYIDHSQEEFRHFHLHLRWSLKLGKLNDKRP